MGTQTGGIILAIGAYKTINNLRVFSPYYKQFCCTWTRSTRQAWFYHKHEKVAAIVQ